MFLYNPIGKTLAEVGGDCGVSLRGYSVFVLQDESDRTGEEIDTNFSINMILEKYPEYADYIVKYENDFFGIAVLRVIKGGS